MTTSPIERLLKGVFTPLAYDPTFTNKEPVLAYKVNDPGEFVEEFLRALVKSDLKPSDKERLLGDLREMQIRQPGRSASIYFPKVPAPKKARPMWGFEPEWAKVAQPEKV